MSKLPYMKLAQERVANYLRVIRAMICQTQMQMAESLNVSLSTYNAIEQGTQDFKISFLDKLQTMYNTDITSILKKEQKLEV